MARPKKEPGAPTAKQRLDAAFLELVTSIPFEQVTVKKITELAGLNRGTFYYYYVDVYEALDTLAESLVPKDQIRHIIRDVYFNGSFSGAFTEHQIELSREMIASETSRIDKICLLLNSGAAPRVSKILKKTIEGFWKEEFGINLEGADANMRFVFEFFVNGLFGILAYRAEIGNTAEIATITNLLIPEMPEGFLRLLRKSNEELQFHSSENYKDS